MRGTRKVCHDLVNQGWIVGTDQVAGVMRDLGIQGVRGGKHPITHDKCERTRRQTRSCEP
ncbi:IS3 family transposase [Scardovia wiggsiae]|uniref:IS3 family transposase n=1 Tax=Scardovia wiggsiae TaxID=230143 RepID=UPI00374F5440